MLSALTSADRVIVTLGPAGDGIEAHMEATCRTQDDASILASQLRSTTALLKEALTRDKNAADDDVATLLTAGSFDQKDRRVTGRWPDPEEPSRRAHRRHLMRKVTLTFDNGPEPRVTPFVLDCLANHNLKATFFVLGHKVCEPERARIAMRAQ